MHTFTTPSGLQIHHNGSFDGDVIILVSDADVEVREFVDGTKAINVRVPFDDIKSLVAEYVRRRKIAELEEVDQDQVLGVVDDYDATLDRYASELQDQLADQVAERVNAEARADKLADQLAVAKTALRRFGVPLLSEPDDDT